ncbi:MAG: GSCFA domain-containing protein [Paludibacteraceae bacterium]|nr:GSCFA domain-containing protein [Paludibacteraceae bacterium]
MDSFRTIIPIQKELDINHSNKVMMFGSCFTENIGQKLIDHKFSVSCNPLGILFNPISILQAINRIVDNKKVTEQELFEHEGVWNSFSFHSQFAQLSVSEYLANINPIIDASHQFIKSCDFLFITLGTAWIYEDTETNEIVANCHKVASTRFNRRRVSTTECCDAILSAIEKIHKVNEHVNFIFTVSPIRHWKDGAHGNQLSKATLLLAIDKICDMYSNCSYFPSYEILMDELRDYRFYADDMLHPSEFALKYIWERFSDCYFSEETKAINKEVESLNQALHHRPFNPESHSYKTFQEQTQTRIAELEKKYPFIKF